MLKVSGFSSGERCVNDADVSRPLVSQKMRLTKGFKTSSSRTVPFTGENPRNFKHYVFVDHMIMYLLASYLFQPNCVIRSIEDKM
jgi:hypothetical protein